MYSTKLLLLTIDFIVITNYSRETYLLSGIQGEFFNLRLQNIWKNKHFQEKCFRQKLFGSKGEVKGYH